VRLHLFIVSTMIVAAGAILYCSVMVYQQNFVFQNRDKQKIEKFIAEFREENTPNAEINLTALYGRRGQFQILHPQFEVKNLRPKLPTSACAGDETDSVFGQGSFNTCDPSNLNDDNWVVHTLEGLKHQTFVRILSRQIKPTENFIRMPPFTESDTGASYAYLLQNKIPPYNTASWVAEHLSFFKPSELKTVLNKYRIDDPIFRIVAQLSSSEIKEMVEGSSIVLTPNFLLVRNQSRLGFSPLSYWAYDGRDLRSALKSQNYDLVAYSSDAICLERLGNVCWTYNSKTAVAYVYRYGVVILICSAILLLVMLIMYARYTAQRTAEQNKQRISLQVLSHEFRTPVTSILLLVEELNRKLARLDEKDQDLVTKISAEASRLQRIIEMSKTYLQSTSKANRFNYHEIPSINEWVQEFASDLDPRIHCELLETDRAVKADPFWLRFALANLVQNAFLHGKEPVSVKILNSGSGIVIAVEDQGHCEFDSIGVMTEPFVKSTKSEGMGLGLNITHAIVKEWGGNLQFQRSPTSFALALNNDTRGAKRWLGF
jgi:signal transduction histidine kinase